MTFTGGNTQNKPVKVDLGAPASVRDGTKVYVTVWKGTSCSAAPDTWERRVGVDPKAGSWTDPAFGQGTWCYLVHIENRYGATRPADGACPRPVRAGAGGAGRRRPDLASAGRRLALRLVAAPSGDGPRRPAEHR